MARAQQLTEQQEDSVPPPAPPSASGMQQAFLSRRRISIRVRVVGLFVIIFLFLAILTGMALVFLSRFRSKSVFLENVAKYEFEIQQARRYEKNFFLYGTNLADALANTKTAQNYLDRSSEAIISIVGSERYHSMDATLSDYAGALMKLAGAESEQAPRSSAGNKQIEIRLRETGAQIVTDARDMIERERIALHSMLHSSRLMVLGFLVFMFFTMAYIATFIVRAIVTPLNRFVRYTERIGLGDYSPIKPVRRYSDEFSDLALAINQMLQELKTHQDQLMQARKMAAVGRLTSGIAHELNNPLNNISLNTESLIESFEDYSDEEKIKLLDQIYSQVERAGSTVRNLLDFTRKDPVAFTAVSMTSVLASTAKLAGNEMKLAGVELRMSLDEDLPPVHGNPSNLKQVFLNLIINAVQAMPGGGSISVRACRSGGFVQTDISDTGCGISAENLEKIFEPFFTTKDPGQGTGLGLSVSYSIIEKHKGRIAVRSQPGQGTTFSVFLPVAEGH